MNNSTNSKKTIRKSFAMFVLTGYFPTRLFAQIFLFNNGAQIYIASTAIIHVNGGFQNDNTASMANVFENNGTMTIATISGIPGSVFLTNNSNLQGNGTYLVEQDWTNDASFVANNSTVNFRGNLQQYITSTNLTVTTFNNLVLTGTGIGNNRKKTLQLIDATIGSNGTLVLNDRELETLTNTMFVLNPSVTSITNNTIPGSEGFVSSSFNIGGSGFLSRTTNSISAYVYPTGCSISGSKYRPVILTPAASSSNSYTARLGYNDATSDGFITAALDTSMCIVNPLFYHEITRSSGSDNANIDIFYDQSADGGWDGMAKWNSSTPNSWNEMGAVVATSGSPFNDVLKTNWLDFSNSPYILSRKKPEAPLLICSSVCANSSGNTFSAIGTGSTYTWTSPPGTLITSGQNTSTVTIDWGTLTGPITVSASSPLNCTSDTASCAVSLSASPFAQFSTESLENHYYSITNLSTGGATQWIWDFGDGETSNVENPSNVYFECGKQKICLTASNNNCIDTTCSEFDVNELAIIPNVFSPDGDGINDVFYINNTCLKDFYLEIFNRWGMKIFETTKGGGWDGYTASGIKSPDGTYYYIFKGISIISNKDYGTAGAVSLVRKQ